MTKTTFVMITLATVAMAFIASHAFANDNQTVSGAGNVVEQNSHNINGNSNTGTNAGGNINVAGGSAKAYGGDAWASAKQDQKQQQQQEQGQMQFNSSKNENNNDGNKQSVSFSDKKQAPGVYAPGLTSGIDTCLGSVSAGGSIAGFGLTGGGTVVDENCVRIKLSREASVKKLETASLYLLCLNDDFRAGVRLEKGKKCPQDEQQEVSASSRTLGALSPASTNVHPRVKNRFE